MKSLMELIEEIECKPLDNNIGYISPSLQEEEELERTKNIIVPQLAHIEKEIDYLFSVSIKQCKNVEEAQKYFDILQQMQEIIGGLFFGDKIKISGKMENFIRECDRLDDPWLRQYLFNKIQQEKCFFD